MTELLVTAVVLGVAGIDPAGLLLALGSLAAGARERTVLAFTAIVVFGTTALGVGLTLSLGRRLQGLDWSSLLPPDWLGALIEGLVAVALLVWMVCRIRRPDARPPRPGRRDRTGAALLGAGVLFAASAPLDPTFVGLVVLAGRGEPTVALSLAHLAWIVVSQLPLVALAVAIALRRHNRMVSWFQGFLSRARPSMRRLGTVALGVAGTVMVVDAAWWLVTGQFLLPDPT